jgi:DNA processing protein
VYDERAYWLGFSLIPGVGRRAIEYLLEHFGRLSTAWAAGESGLRAAGVKSEKILAGRRAINLEIELTKVERSKARLIILEDDDYPALLKPLPDSPPLLYVRGTLRPDDVRALAVVGTRRATTYGKDATARLVRDLTASDVTIVSGLAQGIDAAAHTACLRDGGRTFAVFGCSIDRIYPHEHAALAGRIVENGALISEFALGTPPTAHNFPRRNRIISGLSLGVLVVEAPESSGALITATYAAEHGRDVFAVPANIFNPAGVGTNRLIQDGAKLVTSAADILDELNITYENVQTRQYTERIQPATETEAAVLALLTTDPQHIDALVRQSGLPTSTVSSTLAILELKGLAQMVGHMQYSLVY